MPRAVTGKTDSEPNQTAIKLQHKTCTKKLNTRNKSLMQALFTPSAQATDLAYIFYTSGSPHGTGLKSFTVFDKAALEN